MTEAGYWRFEASEARDAAHEVVHHDPDTPRARLPVPADTEAAAASIVALAAEFVSLPPSIRGALGRATTNAARLSDDRLQGLAELLQNADDVGADEAFFVVQDDRLIFGHDGGGFTLPDVWGLTIPWLSDKSESAAALGRFGIGLKTLQSLSDTLEVHNGYFHFSLQRSTISPADSEPGWENRPDAANTVFIVPFARGEITQTEVADWLARWGDAGLLFLHTLKSVTLLNATGKVVTRLRLTRDQSETVVLRGSSAVRSMLSADDGRRWLLYSRSATSPASTRGGKAQTDTTPIAVAFPQFTGDEGHIHVGLPVRSLALPFRFSGQFDPLASRRDIAGSRWNRDLLELVAGLWLDAALDLFELNARNAWSAVPLDVESGAQSGNNWHLDDALDRSLMNEARLAFANAVQLASGARARHSLGSLAYEAAGLTGILSEADIRRLGKSAGVLGEALRSADDRWRAVLDDLARLGAQTPTIVDAASAMPLLGHPEQPIMLLADLSAAVIAAIHTDHEHGAALSAELKRLPCLVLADGTRLSPMEATGLRVLLPPNPSRLWSELGMGAEVHPQYANRPSWPAIAKWLQAHDSMRLTATAADALRALSEAGHNDLELPQPLADIQADALRTALEAVDESARPALGAGIGRAVRLEATVYDVDGKRMDTFARPVDAYFIEKDRNTWSTAARRTPGLIWLHRRYSEDLRAETGRAGIGAQKLFRLLGAESVPRLVRLPDDEGYYKHYVYYRSGLWRDAPGSPPRRQKQMNAVGAQCTLDDLASPDLERVLKDIAREKSGDERRRRATALLGCLTRNWDQFAPHARVTAANPDSGWITRGEVDAWWVHQAASIAWLTNGRGRRVAPGDIRLRTPTNEAMHGTDPALYLADANDQPLHRGVLTALGVEGNPTVAAMINRLSDIRQAHLAGQSVSPHGDGQPMTIREAADLAAPLYQALAAEVHGAGQHGRVGNMQAAAARAHFDRGDGLIITNLGWRRTAATLSGDAVFGDLAPFVPAVAGVEPLWAALGVRAPNADDANRALKQLSGQRAMGSDDRQIMLEALRLLVRMPPERLGGMRRQPVYIGDGWTSKRPVYAIENPLLAGALAEQVPVWQPGGQLTRLVPLIDPLGLTLLDTSHARVVDASVADYDWDLTALFKTAVRNLQTDLTLSAPAAAQAIRVTWDEFAEFRVALVPDLRIWVDLPREPSHQVGLDAWLDQGACTLFLSNREEASRARSGGYAIASLFDGNPRDLAHAWVVAWSDARAGSQAELVVSAAERAAEEKRRREVSQAALLALGGSRRSAKPHAVGKMSPKPSQLRPATSGRTQASQKARTLVDVSTLALREPRGAIVTGVSVDKGVGLADTRGGVGAPSGQTKLREPDRDRPKTPTAAGRGPLNYTAEERESIGLELLRQVLADDDVILTDVRHQPNVGADAVDNVGRFYELKVHAGAIPDGVRLEDSQLQRAFAADEFYLVLVGNVEDGQGDPEVRIIHDPLHHLKPEAQGAVHLTGVLTARVARSWTFGSSESADEH